MAEKKLQVKEKKAIDKSEGEPTKKGVYFTPLVDIYETDDGITLKADLPGADEKNLDIDLREGILTITAPVEPPAAQEQLVYREYEVGGFTRSFRVGKDVDQQKISAKLKDGVLDLFLPKAEQMKPRKIPVKTD
jgi:HSP20 family protein